MNRRGSEIPVPEQLASARGTSIAFVYNTARYLLNMRGTLIRTLIDSGMKVHAVVPVDDAVSELRSMGVAVHDWQLSGHGMNPWREWSSYRALIRLLSSIRADIVFSFTIKPVIYASAAAHATGCSRVFSMVPGRGYLFGDDTVAQRALQVAVGPVYRRSLQLNRKVFFQNSDDREYFISRRYVLPEQAVVVDGSGVDVDHFTPCPELVEPGSFLLVARLLKEKGIEEFVEAARLLKPRYPMARFRILGPYSRSPSAVDPKVLEGWREEGVIEYLGEANDVRPHLARCMVFVLPSYYGEGLPRTALEALAMAKPVITTDWAGCRETVNDGKNGFLVPVRDARALATAMERILVDPERCGAMGRNSRSLAQSRFDVRQVNQTVIGQLLQ